MTRLLNRLYLLLFSLIFSLRLRAQGEFDDDDMPGLGGDDRRTLGDDMDMMDMDMDYPRFRLGFDDIFLIVVLLIACYVFGKIWRGCSYLILIAAAVFYYLNRY